MLDKIKFVILNLLYQKAKNNGIPDAVFYGGKMIYITGDTHGDISRFKSSSAHKIKKGDTLIICGDFGYVWNESAAEMKTMNWLSRRNYEILFVEGAHENYQLLAKFPIVDYKGGKARKIANNIYQLLRGEIFKIEDKKIFAFGGGDDEEMDLMDLPETNDFKRLPSDEEIERARKNIQENGSEVDYFITYDVGFKMRAMLKMDSSLFNNLHAFLFEAGNMCKYDKWFFGCYHMDKLIPPSYYAVYQKIINAETGKE